MTTTKKLHTATCSSCGTEWTTPCRPLTNMICSDQQCRIDAIAKHDAAMVEHKAAKAAAPKFAPRPTYYDAGGWSAIEGLNRMLAR